MTTSNGYHYKEGVRVGYYISVPNNFGGRMVLSNVASTDKARIVNELKQQGYSKDEIEIEKY